MATKKGIIKKTPIIAYANIRKTGIQSIVLKEDDIQRMVYFAFDSINMY